MIIYFPGVREMLSQASRCAVCSEAFLNTWLECVKFVKADSVSILRSFRVTDIQLSPNCICGKLVISSNF